MTHKEKQADELKSAQARAAKAEFLLKGPRPQTHSATMPAYAYTVACPDQGLREPPRIRPVGIHKMCLICRKKWPADCGRSNCDCERKGRLYATGVCYQPKAGGRQA